MLDLKPAPYAFAIDRARAARGQPIFAARCASCHAFGGDKVGTSILIELEGTDRHRFDSRTDEAKDAFLSLDQFSWKIYSFPEDRWIRRCAARWHLGTGSYLHNGSVPSLKDLLETPSLRPKVFIAVMTSMIPET
jgi:hypothetical protein